MLASSFASRTLTTSLIRKSLLSTPKNSNYYRRSPSNILTSARCAPLHCTPSSFVRQLTTHAFEDVGRGQSAWKGKNFWILLPIVGVLLPSSVLYCKNINTPSTPDAEEELEDTAQLYESKPTRELFFQYAILKLCSIEMVVNYGPKLLEWAEKNYLATISRWCVKQTFFRNFVAGETMEECASSTDKLRKDGIGAILDYSIEAGSSDKAELDAVADQIIRAVQLASRDPSSAFGCLKVSGLTSFALLERVSSLVQYYNRNPSKLPLVLESQRSFTTRNLPSAVALSSPPPPLSNTEQQELQEVLERLDKICKVSHDLNVPMLVDAEQTYYQPAIDLFALYMCRKYNDKRPIVYNTYQMYLKNSPERLLSDINYAKKEGFHLGIKIVRGAYMHTERERAKELRYDDPINENIEATHRSYEKGVDIALHNLDNVGLLIASHNENTIVTSLEKVREMKIDPKTANVQFGQLYGMADHLTLLLVHNGQKVFKYVPFGPVEHVIPYLVRRMHENRGFIGSTSAKERNLLWKEIKRRIFVWPSQKPTPTPSATTTVTAPGTVN